MRRTLMLALMLASAAAQSQTASAPAARASAPARAASAAATPAKKALVAKLLKLEQPGVENLARQLVQQPALQLLQQVNAALQGVPADRREQVAKDIESDARKYIEEATPIVRDRAVALAPQTIGPMLEESFTEDELKQLIALLESPAIRKYQAMQGQVQRAFGERLIADTRDSIEPKVRALQQSVSSRLQPAAPAASAPASAPK